MTLKISLVILKLISVVKFINADVESKIVNGEFTNIKDFPHSVFVSINCNGKVSSCGASILNQAILLTAAHCLVKCKRKFSIQAYTGAERKKQGFESKVTRFKIHEGYDTFTKVKDIALMKLEKELKFGTKVKRVAIMRTPPRHRNAVIAGWGWIDSKGTRSDFLKHAKQQVFSRKTCFTKVRFLPYGTFCGRDFKGSSYPEKGDSGSALVVGSIQIGLVSFKKRKLSNDTIAYTDVSYYYDWIVKNARDLYCDDKSKMKSKWTQPKWKNKLFDETERRMGEDGLNLNCSLI